MASPQERKFLRTLPILECQICSTKHARLSSAIASNPANVGGTENRATVTQLLQVQCFTPTLNAPTDVDFSGESQASSSLYAVAKFFDCYDSIRENGSDFQPSAHRLNEVAQCADVHIGSALKFRNGSLVYPENC